MPVSPDYAAILAKTLLEIYTTAEEALLVMISKRLARGIDEPGWIERQLSSIQGLRLDTATLIQILTDQGIAALGTAILTAYNRGVALAGTDLVAAGTHQAIAFGGVNLHAMRALVDEAKTTLGATQLPIQSSAQAVYRSVIHDVGARMLTGTLTTRQAAAVAVKTWADRGITSFTDKAGRSWEMGSYAEMATRTLAGQAMVAGHVDRLTETGHDLSMVSDAPEECKLCRPWEGKVLSMSGNTLAGIYRGPHGNYTVAGTLQSATSAGLFHPNCRHRLTLYLPGITQPLHDTQDPEGDALRQQQRAFERRVRELKRRVAALAEIDPKGVELTRAKAQLRSKVSEFSQWREANDRKNLSYRTSITNR